MTTTQAKQYRKKPVVIEAVQWNGQPPQVVADSLAVDVGVFRLPPWYAPEMPPSALQIVTLEGTMEASVGDWIIKGVADECYPCKPGIFALTYEACND